jgi:hypothetical protein
MGRQPSFAWNKGFCWMQKLSACGGRLVRLTRSTLRAFVSELHVEFRSPCQTMVQCRSLLVAHGGHLRRRSDCGSCRRV